MSQSLLFRNGHHADECTRRAILLYKGRDCTEEFNMLHEKDVVKKYAPNIRSEYLFPIMKWTSC